MRIGHTFSAVLNGRRTVARAEASTLIYGAAMALAIAAVSVQWPRVIAVPLAVIVAWVGAAWAVRAWKLYRQPREPAPRDAAAEDRA
jgi:cardiolipin synthase